MLTFLDFLACGMGNVNGENLSALPKCCKCCNSGKVLSHLLAMGHNLCSWGRWRWPITVRVWNPLYPRDRLHRMPVITPAYPSMCATHNMLSSTQEAIIVAWVQKRCWSMNDISIRKKEWGDLFCQTWIFLQIQVSACAVAAQRKVLQKSISKWSSMV